MSDMVKIAEVQKSPTCNIITSWTRRKAPQGFQYAIDIREFLNTDGYTGFTKRGVRLTIDDMIGMLPEIADAIEAGPENAEWEKN